MKKINGRLHDLKPFIDCNLSIWPMPKSGATPSIPCKALLDTGSTDVIIRKKHVEALGLVESEPPVFSTSVGHSGKKKCFRTSILFPYPDPIKSKGFSLIARTEVRTLLSDFSDEHDIIIGMNVLETFDFVFRKGGEFELVSPD